MNLTCHYVLGDTSFNISIDINSGNLRPPQPLIPLLFVTKMLHMIVHHKCFIKLSYSIKIRNP